jgi:hypothetical protein
MRMLIKIIAMTMNLQTMTLKCTGSESTPEIKKLTLLGLYCIINETKRKESYE